MSAIRVGPPDLVRVGLGLVKTPGREFGLWNEGWLDALGPWQRMALAWEHRFEVMKAVKAQAERLRTICNSAPGEPSWWHDLLDLERWGGRVEKLPLPAVKPGARSTGMVTFSDDSWFFGFDRGYGDGCTERDGYDRVMWARLPGTGWPSNRMNYGPGQGRALKAAAMEHGWTLDVEATEAVFEAAREAVEIERASRASGKDEGRGMKDEGGDGAAALGLELGVVPRAYQWAGVDYLVRTRRAILGDEMGLGKTGQALVALRAIEAEGRGQESEGIRCFPCVVVTVAVCKPGWAEEVGRWLPGARAVVWGGRGGGRMKAKIGASRLGGATFAPESEAGEDVVHVLNWEILADRLPELMKLGIKAVILDESHRIKNRKTKRAMAAKVLGKRKVVKFCLSGTPVENRPAELLAQLEFLGRVEDVGGWRLFSERYCGAVKRKVRVKGEGGRMKGEDGASRGGGHRLETCATFREIVDYSGPKFGTPEWVAWQRVLREELAPALRGCCLLRRTASEVLKDLPAKCVTRVPIGMDAEGWARYRAAEADVKGWLAAKAGQGSGVRIQESELQREQRVAAALERLDGMELLLKLGTLRQVAGEGKLARALEWMEHFLEESGVRSGPDGHGQGSGQCSYGRKLLGFAHHVAIVRGVFEHFNGQYGRGTCVVIDGQCSARQKVEAVRRFREDAQCGLLMMNWQSGGTGLDGLQRGCRDVAILEEPWTPSTLDQGVARVGPARQAMVGPGREVNEWHLTAPGTVDEVLWDRVAAKREVAKSGLDDRGPLTWREKVAPAVEVARSVARALLSGQRSEVSGQEARI